MIRKVSNSNYYRILEEGKKVGYFSLMNSFNNERLGFWNFTIFEEFRGKGYGKKALSDLLKRLKKQGLDVLWLYVYKTNTIALNLYKSLGFEIIEDRYDTYWMEVKIK